MVNISETQQTIVFQLENEFYGVDIFRVNEIIRLREITPIPGTEAHIRGLVNLRGKTIPVIDLKARFGMGSCAEAASTRIIVLDSDDGNVGILVDAVREVLTLATDDIEQAPALVTDLDNEFVRGVAKSANTLITLLNIDQALAA
ncbi:MAG: purine-binding chemotaxis protein CheW [Chthonomonas sp.]|nr:purine-binding chemotaxis protein CheW [Chthonomonas sp.]